MAYEMRQTRSLPCFIEGFVEALSSFPMPPGIDEHPLMIRKQSPLLSSALGLFSMPPTVMDLLPFISPIKKNRFQFRMHLNDPKFPVLQFIAIFRADMDTVIFEVNIIPFNEYRF